MTTKTTVYLQIHESAVPPGAVFVTPGRNQGQTIEVSYSTGASAGNVDADHGATFQRIVDRAANTTTYYRRAYKVPR